MWTIAGYAQDFVKKHIDDKIFETHKDKLELHFLTQKKRTDPHAGLLGIGIICPVPAPLYSGVVEKLTSKLEKQLGLPQSRWNTGESDIEGCVLLRLFFGVDLEDEAEKPLGSDLEYRTLYRIIAVGKAEFFGSDPEDAKANFRTQAETLDAADWTFILVEEVKDEP